MSKFIAEYTIVLTTVIEADSHADASEIALHLDTRSVIAGAKIKGVTENEYVPDLNQIYEEE